MSDEPLYAYVGRQAIFDRQRAVVAYELLYRDSEENRAQFSGVLDAEGREAEIAWRAVMRRLAMHEIAQAGFAIGDAQVT